MSYNSTLRKAYIDYANSIQDIILYKKDNNLDASSYIIRRNNILKVIKKLTSRDLSDYERNLCD